MGQIVTITIGASVFSVYATSSDAVASANTYFTGRLGTDAAAWVAADTDSKKRALVTAADWLDRACGSVFSGAKTVSSQAREWPRDGATDYGAAIASGTTPDEVAHAEFWLAGQLLLDSSLASSAGTGSNVKIAKAGSASVTFFTPTIGTAQNTRLPVTAMDYLKRFFGGSATVYAAGAASGISTDSAFSPCNFTRSEGFS